MSAECNPAFNRDSSSITFADIGLGPDGDTDQIFTMDLATGQRHQVTELPPAIGIESHRLPTAVPRFIDFETIVFRSYANPVIDGVELNPQNEFRVFSVKIHDPATIRVVPFFAEPGNAAEIIEAFQITGSEPLARGIPLRGEPVNEGEGFLGPVIYETFVLDGANVLQVTNFMRSDTGGSRMTADGQRMVFFAAADPLGTNPFGNCQLFSVDRTGADMRQLTNFDEGKESEPGCVIGANEESGCWILMPGLGEEASTGSIVFTSNCDPFGTNPNGSQVFAVRPDGTGLRQVTHARGMVVAPDRTVTVELPGPSVNGSLSGEN